MFNDMLSVRFSVIVICSFFLGFGELSAQNIVSVMNDENEISNFVDALENAQLTEKLNGNGPYTIFAPSNGSFNNSSVSNQNRSRSNLLNYIMTGMATERNLKAMSNITTLGGMVLNLRKTNSGEIRIEDRAIVTANIRASNGVIHIIDGTF